MKKNGWILVVAYAAVILSFIIYSYTQVDLNLTLSTNHYYQAIQQQLTQIGYFNRSLSATLFLLQFAALFGLYTLILWLIVRKKLDSSLIWKIVAVTAFLIIAYPAFSHDIFNYMFDARIVTQYGLDPHFFKALDFPLDPWTRFMRWTHRYFPYGPGWLLLSLMPSYLGMGKFVVTLLLFKLMFLAFHIVNCILIQKILEKISPANSLFGLVIFALNPLVLIESIVSPHNEVVMLALALLAIYLFMKKNMWGMVMSIVASVCIKYVSGVLLPLMWWKKANHPSFFTYAYGLWALLLIPVIIAREFYPWYLMPLVGLAALTNASFIKVFTIGISAGTILRYFPYLYFGSYDGRTTLWQWWSLVVGTVVCGLIFLIVVWPKSSGK